MDKKLMNIQYITRRSIAIAVFLFAGQKKKILIIGFLCMAFAEGINIVLQHLMFETYSIEHTEDQGQNRLRGMRYV